MEAAQEPHAHGSKPERPLWRVSPLALIPLLLIRLYQWTLSPLLGPTCRFEPSCSRYADACLRRFGFIRGAWLATRRILRCQPFHPGGYDPPPDHWPPPRLRRRPPSAAVANLTAPRPSEGR